MKNYSNAISLYKNNRGVYSLDPSIGCNSGIANNPNGCYNDCYAFRTSKIYGYNFSNTVLKQFINKRHLIETCNKILNCKSQFIRMGTNGDPSENWEHTINIIEKIKFLFSTIQFDLFSNISCKELIIVTKHWRVLKIKQLEYLSNINVCINTSISALDDPKLIIHRLKQYNIIKQYCKSVLRVVTCDFNLNSKTGNKLFQIQTELLKNDNVIETIFRPSYNNELVINKIINTKETVFLKSKVLVSMRSDLTYFGTCNNCKDQCSITVNHATTDKQSGTRCDEAT